MIIKEIECKSCLNKSKLTDYVINPYTGCEHACKYCYATFIRRFQDIKEPWGKFLYIKKNCPELLTKELEKAKPGNIWMSSVTDPYLPLEARYRLTRRILETINSSEYKNKFTIEILTKSTLVKRDFDLLKDLNADLGMSINTLNNEVASIIEPKASAPTQRIKVLREAKEHGINVYGFISPFLPGITDLEQLFKELNFCEYVWIELLNTKKSVLDEIIPIYKKYFKEKLKDLEYYINNQEEFYKNIKKQSKGLEKKYNLKVKDIIVH